LAVALGHGRASLVDAIVGASTWLAQRRRERHALMECERPVLVDLEDGFV
jgi:hypothetical protein